MSSCLEILKNFEKIVKLCKESKIGKHLPKALYVHISTLKFLDPLLQEYEQEAKKQTHNIEDANIIKFNLEEPKISYLSYPDFDQDPHPAIRKSILVNLRNQTVTCYLYESSKNPPILHRKETFITPEYPHYQEFAYLSFLEESLGLLDNTRYIGTREQWLQLLEDHHLKFEGHSLICPRPSGLLNKKDILRHKAAIVRKKLSRPVQIALEAGLLTPNCTFFDYGCGYGEDVKLLTEKGYQCSKWDPFYAPNNVFQEADVVNLGYVINVIENLAERRETLLKAWSLARQILLVSAQVLINERNLGLVVYGDGIITERNTFQKYYQQEELKTYIDQILEVDSIPVALGIFVVFKDENRASTFRASRFHSQVKTPKVLVPHKKFADYKELLTPLMNFYTNRGRLPIKGELKEELEIRLKQEFRTIRRAFQVILQVTQQEDWDNIADKRRQEILIYLALSRFTKRPTIRKLPQQLKIDIKALFDNYQAACFVADEMLINLKNLELIKKLCAESKVGKMFERSFLIHVSVLDSLPTLLRLYEGCASQNFGRLERTNLVRFYFNIPKISYLYYSSFDEDAHPILRTSMTVNLQYIRIKYSDFTNDDNPPILHEKDKLVAKDYPLYQKFSQLTKQEKEAGLLDNLKENNHLQNWQNLLKKSGLTIKNYQIIADNAIIK
jgi:DNA phosphorothioation-associated putative methyltransferase